MRGLRLLAAISVTAAMAGCASAKAATGTTPAPSTSSTASASAGAAAAPNSSAAGPSASALMVCGTEIKTAVETILTASPAPTTTATWADHLYTCTYHLPTGTLVLSVKESPDTPSANTYLTTLQHQLGTTTPLTGSEGLGNPGFQNASGNVVVLKDDKTLHVDATGLPAASGPSRLSRADVAYEVTTDILGCWTGK
ncbi:hypothetical protein KGQ20_25660 [Catenulispora sp. NF23]|uniref:hypothetical protein n=1 Tax=Catenulispora pinistramenti TaxID=2705254 RepID=UPI001BAE3FD8|nr:hypothetical protein [Catenulispora pinistramenti]MBS2536155.1 hypothetical protein [Catenulispora pinistramenti]